MEASGIWVRTAGPLVLQPGELHVWQASLDLPAPEVAALSAALDADECRRAARFAGDRLQARFKAGRGVLRALLGRYLGMASGEVRIRVGTHGKPELDPGHDSVLRFNVSHTESLLVVAVASGCDVGVDIERHRPVADADALVVRFFSASEREAFARVDPTDRSDVFLRCWTRKEAYVKALGAGLSMSLDSFDVTVARGEFVALQRVFGDTAALTNWTLRDLAPLHDDAGVEHFGAVAAASAALTIRYMRWTHHLR